MLQPKGLPNRCRFHCRARCSCDTSAEPDPPNTGLPMALAARTEPQRPQWLTESSGEINRS